MNLNDLLQQVACGELAVAEAETILAARAETNLGFARVDLDRLRRRGLAEVRRVEASIQSAATTKEKDA